MPIPLYAQRVIAVIWDFDRTLIPGNMQDPIFDDYGVDSDSFWAEVDGLVDFYSAQGVPTARDSCYLGHLLTYVDAGLFPGLNNKKLKELGGQLKTAPGMPDFLQESRKHVESHPGYGAEGISVEHYVISTGIRPMIQGSEIAPYLDGIWANSFIESPAPPGYLGELPVQPGGETEIKQLGYTIDNTSKTKAVFEINKGVNKNQALDVNARMSEDQRRVPISHMVYVADGPSDVPVFSILNERGGKTLGVYTTDPRNNFRQVKQLQEQGRIQGMAEADYRPGGAAYLWLMDSLDQIADGIVEARRRVFDDIPPAPGHV